MYIDQNLKKDIVNQKIIGVYIGIDKDVSLTLENYTSIGIINSFTIPDRFENLIGKKIIDIQEKPDAYVKFLLDDKSCIDVNMSDGGFINGPEALDIKDSEDNRYIIRGVDDICVF